MKNYNKKLKEVFDKKLKEIYGDNYEQEEEFRQNLLDEIEKQVKNTTIEYIKIGIQLRENEDKTNGCKIDFEIPHRRSAVFKLENLTDKKIIKKIAKCSVFDLKRSYEEFLEKELEKLNNPSNKYAKDLEEKRIAKSIAKSMTGE